MLDPRKKLTDLEFCFSKVFDENVVKEMIGKVKNVLTMLFDHYASYDSSNVEVPITNETSTMSIDDDDPHSFLASQFSCYLEVQFCSGTKSEFDKYLADIEQGSKSGHFDMLKWWKVNSTRYKVLSQIARDVLAIHVSTVASESAFSTGGRILDLFRSTLAPSSVEILV